MGKREERQLGSVPRHILALLAVASATASCAPAREHKLEGRTMGTSYHVTVVGRVSASGLQEKIDRRLEEVNDSLSTYRPESEINRFSRFARTGEEFPVCRDFLEVMKTAARVHALSGGAWDGTVRPLVDLWGFGPLPPVAEPPAPEDRGPPRRGRVREIEIRPRGLVKRQAVGDPRPVLDREGLRRRPGGRGHPAARASPTSSSRSAARSAARAPAGTAGPGGWGSTARGPTPRPTRSTAWRPCATRPSPRAATTATSSSGTACATRTCSTRGPAARWRTAS